MAEGYQTTVHDKVGGRSADADQTCAEDNVPGRKGKRCDPCRTKGRWNDAVVLCKTCQQHQCEECSMNHSLNDIMVGHDLQGLEEEEQRKICIKHKQDVNIYCVDHDEMCCGLCCVMYHKQCTEVTDITSGGKLSLSNIRGMCENINKDAEKRMQTYQNQAKDIPDQIDIMKNEIVKLFDDFKCNVVQSFRDAVKIESKEIDEEKIVRTAITKDIDTTSYSDDSCRMYLFTKKIRQHKHAISKQESDQHVLDFIFEINKTLLSFIQSGDDIGSLHVQNTFTKATAGTFARPFMLRLLASRNLKQGGGYDQEPFVTGLDFLPDGRIVGVDNTNNELLIFDDSLDVLATQKTTRSYDVACFKDDTIAYSCGTQVVFTEISKNNTIKVLQATTYTRKKGSFSIMHGDRLCASTYDDKYPACVVSASEEKEFEPKLPEQKYKWGEYGSATTFIPNRQIVVVSDLLDNSVSFHDVSGSICVTTVVKDDRIKSPRGLSVGPGDCVFVCCSGTNSIVQLSPTGRVIGSCKVNMNSPRAVAVSKDGQKLVVSNSYPGQKQIQVYQFK